MVISSDAGVDASDILCLGISTQRCTIITWDKQTGKHYHNFITWNDLRADSLVRKHNSSFLMQVHYCWADCVAQWQSDCTMLVGLQVWKGFVRIKTRLELPFTHHAHICLFKVLSWIIIKKSRLMSKNKFLKVRCYSTLHPSQLVNCLYNVLYIK